MDMTAFAFTGVCVFLLLYYIQHQQSAILRTEQEKLSNCDRVIQELRDALFKSQQTIAEQESGIRKQEADSKRVYEEVHSAKKMASEQLKAIMEKQDRRINGLIQKKDREVALKDDDIVNKENTIAAKNRVIAKLRADFEVDREKSDKAMEIVRLQAVALTAKLEQRGRDMTQLRFDHEQEIRDLQRRRDSAVSADYALTASQFHHMEAKLQHEAHLLEQAHARELHSIRRQHEFEFKQREMALMRACISDLEHATGLIKSKDSLMPEKRVSEWRGRVAQLEGEREKILTEESARQH